jgi:hypothetical protein
MGKKLRVLSARESHRSHGHYTNRFRSTIAHFGILTEDEWRQNIGDTKFEDAKSFGLLVEEVEPEEELEREGTVIKEKPVAPKQGSPLEVSEVICYKTDPEHILVAKVRHNNVEGMMRLQRGAGQGWSTDNIDLIDAELCKDLAAAQEELWQKAPNQATGDDPGTYAYNIRSQCREETDKS